MSGSYAETSPETDCYATASDNGGVARVEFYVDGALTNTERYAPYSCEFNTAAYPAGNHTLTAKAFDAAGNSATASVAVTFGTSPPPPATGSPSPPVVLLEGGPTVEPTRSLALCPTCCVTIPKHHGALLA